MRGNLATTESARRGLSAYFCQLADSFGLPRSVALIYGTLFLAENPLPVSEIIEESGLSKGSVSSGLRFLERMGFIHLVVAILAPTAPHPYPSKAAQASWILAGGSS